MNSENGNQPGFWTTVGLLLKAARRRYFGRQKRQRQLLRQRTGKKAADLGTFGFLLAVFFMLVLNVLAAVVVRSSVKAGQRVEAEMNGAVVVSGVFFVRVHCIQTNCVDIYYTAASDLGIYCHEEAARISEEYGGKALEIERKLCNEVKANGYDNLVIEEEAAPGLKRIAQTGRLAAMLGSWVLFLWIGMLICQGEGLDLDLQRRRHPMWEWLFSHPVRPGAVFLAEMLSPIAANPVYWGAPLFVGVVYGSVYSPLLGLLAVALVGIPVTVATACVGKALEIAIVLRAAPRSRGAIMGLMSWFGYASMMACFLGSFVAAKIVTAIARPATALTFLPWPWLRLFLGGRTNGSFSFAIGVAANWAASCAVIAGAVWFSVWGAQKGLSGTASASLPRSTAKTGVTQFGKEPLYRKELLWFVRDRSAMVQSMLMPLTVAGIQMFNLRGVLAHAGCVELSLWRRHSLRNLFPLHAGAEILLSEGTALWIALTWPQDWRVC